MEAWSGLRNCAVASVAVMVSLHVQDPREWNKVYPQKGSSILSLRLARTANGGFISAENLDNDEYCASSVTKIPTNNGNIAPIDSVHLITLPT